MMGCVQCHKEQTVQSVLISYRKYNRKQGELVEEVAGGSVR